ncbi:hypothetical protein KCP73_06495 [Salmonella enterica subsp. enterica]|nr:hypothetical protein KCP73_06495 [Salmonella enterica subsp. enterica]
MLVGGMTGFRGFARVCQQPGGCVSRNHPAPAIAAGSADSRFAVIVWINSLSASALHGAHSTSGEVRTCFVGADGIRQHQRVAVAVFKPPMMPHSPSVAERNQIGSFTVLHLPVRTE